MTERFLIKANTLTISGPSAETFQLTFSLALCYSPLPPPTASAPPATAGIFSSLMDGAMSEFQLGRLKRLVRKLESDSDGAAFHYSIYHSILHGDIMPPHLAVLFDLGDCLSAPSFWLQYRQYGQLLCFGFYFPSIKVALSETPFLQNVMYTVGVIRFRKPFFLPEKQSWQSEHPV